MKKYFSHKKESAPKILTADFSAQTPKIAIRSPRLHPLYEKAFLSPGKTDLSEYAPNTTHWDR